MSLRFLTPLLIIMAFSGLAQPRIVSRGVEAFQIPEAYAGQMPQQVGGLTQIGAFEYFTFEYPTIDSEGRPITLSSLAVMPYRSRDKSEPDPRNLVIACHGTITSNAESPTVHSAEGIISDVRLMMFHAASTYDKPESQNLVIMPDYAGFGSNVDQGHPYLCQTVTARNIVDATQAGLQLFLNDTKTDGTPRCFASDNWRTVVVGYSQGASSAMAVHRFIETNNLVDTLHFQGSVCGDGPYDLIATMREYITTGVHMPVVVPFIIHGMLVSNPLLKHRNPSAYFKPEFIATGIIDSILTKRYDTSELCMQIGQYTRLDQMFLPEIMDYFTDERNFTGPLPTERNAANDLHRALEYNNLTLGWQPKCRMALFHSVGDEVVPYVNAQMALNRLGSNVKHVRYESTESNMAHVSVGIKFFAGMLLGSDSPLNLAFRAVMGTEEQWNAYGNDSWIAPKRLPSDQPEVFTADVDGTPVTFTLDANGNAIAGNGYTACVSQYTTGAVNLPEIIEYNGQTYPVVGVNEWAFNMCDKVTSLTLAQGTQSVGTLAASGCAALSEVKLPESVTSIASAAFLDCDALADVTLANPDPNVLQADDAFERGNTAATLHVPAGAREAFLACDMPTEDVWPMWFDVITDDGGGHTGLDSITAKQPCTVYYNLLGQPSRTPWQGVNITSGKKIILPVR